MNVSELPRDTRRKLLGKIREQVGDSNYRQMTGAMGEDGLLQAVLDRGKQAGQAVESEMTWKDWLGLTLFAVFLLFFLISGYQEHGMGGAIGNVFVFFICFCPALIWWLVKWLVKVAGIALAAAGAVAVVGLVGFGLWRAAIYAGAGTQGWFGWLASHF